jgi:ferredoxin
MNLIPGIGIARGMALTLRRFFEPKATIMYPEQPADVAVRFRGRLQLLYDEYGALKCETCFQCAQACPIECIDMGGMDTRGRFHVHWGASETYGERREESALRRSGRTVPDPAYGRFAAIDTSRVDAILEEYDHDPEKMLAILEATQEAYGYLPVAALKRISQRTGAWYAMIYGTASYYGHLRFEPEDATIQAAAVAAHRPPEATYLAAFDAALAGSGKTKSRGKSGPSGTPGDPARA